MISLNAQNCSIEMECGIIEHLGIVFVQFGYQIVTESLVMKMKSQYVNNNTTSELLLIIRSHKYHEQIPTEF